MALKKTHAQFRVIKREAERNHSASPKAQALDCAWWFIENVTVEDPSCSDIFFELREMVRWAQTPGKP